MNNKIPSIVIIAFVLAFILPIVGLILGIIALNKVNKTEEKTGKGLAIASIVIGAILTPLYFMFIGAIAYFGVMNPSTFIPERCVLQTGLNCEIKSIESNNIELELENSFGRELVISEARISYNDNICIDSTEKIIDNNEKTIFNLGNCDLNNLPNRARFDIEIDYYPEEVGEQFKTTANGNFIAQIN